jgi:hypothetical protein
MREQVEPRDSRSRLRTRRGKRVSTTRQARESEEGVRTGGDTRERDEEREVRRGTEGRREAGERGVNVRNRVRGRGYERTREPEGEKCMMSGCKAMVLDMGKHIQNNHLPRCFTPYGREVSAAQCEGIAAALLDLCIHFKVESLLGLLGLILEENYYYNSNKAVTELETQLIRGFERFLGGEELPIELAPPSSVAVLCHWKVVAALLQAAGIPQFKIKVDLARFQEVRETFLEASRVPEQGEAQEEFHYASDASVVLGQEAQEEPLDVE